MILKFQQFNEAKKHGADDEGKMFSKNQLKKAMSAIEKSRAVDFPSLNKLIKKIWDGDVSYEDATSGFSKKELQEMEECLMLFAPLFKQGVPFPGDDEEYDDKVASTKAGKLIQKMIDNCD